MDVRDIPLLGDARKELLKEVVKDYFVKKDMTVCELVEALRGAHGFMAGHVARASEIIA